MPFAVVLRKLFRSLDGSLTEFLKVFHKSESSLTCAGTCSLVSLFNLGVSVYDKLLNFRLDGLNKLFHNLN